MGLFGNKKAPTPTVSQPVRKEASLTEVEYEDEPEAEEDDTEVPTPSAFKQIKKQPQQPQEDIEDADEYQEQEEEIAAEKPEVSADNKILVAIEQNFNDIFDRLVEINVRLEKLEAAAFRVR